MRLLLVLVVACRASAQLPAATELGTTHACETSNITAVDSPKREPPPPAAQRLLAVANELELVPADRARTHVAHAMNALADTLETLVPSAAEAIMQVRDSADALARDKQPRADVVRAGLDAATRAFYELQLQPGK